MAWTLCSFIVPCFLSITEHTLLYPTLVYYLVERVCFISIYFPLCGNPRPLRSSLHLENISQWPNLFFFVLSFKSFQIQSFHSAFFVCTFINHVFIYSLSVVLTMEPKPVHMESNGSTPELCSPCPTSSFESTRWSLNQRVIATQSRIISLQGKPFLSAVSGTNITFWSRKRHSKNCVGISELQDEESLQ